jgi:hypothetical protein
MRYTEDRATTPSMFGMLNFQLNAKRFNSPSLRFLFLFKNLKNLFHVCYSIAILSL